MMTLRLTENKEFTQLNNVGPKFQAQILDPQNACLFLCIGQWSQLNPSDNCTGPQVSLSHDASESPQRWRTFKGPHNLFSFTNYCGNNYCFSSKWGGEGGLHSQGVTVDASTQLCPVSKEHATSRQA